MTERVKQPGSRQAHRCTRHSSPSADLIIRVLQKTEESPLITTVFEIYFSRPSCRLAKSIMDARTKHLTPWGPCLIGWGERGWFGSSNSSNLGQSVCMRVQEHFYCTKSPSSGQCAHMVMRVMLLDKHGGKLLQEAMKCGYFITS